MSFEKLDAHCHSLSALEHALSILGVDEATAMAPGGGEQRAEAMASLSGMLHRQATDPKLTDLDCRRQGRGFDRGAENRC
jgi:carboxypeptidase Taq